jgi:hypothetical protein
MKLKPAQKRKIEAPDGYESTDDFLAEARERFQEAVDFDRANRDAGIDDLKFLTGDQWDETQKAIRIGLGLPAITINTLPQLVGQVIGDMRINQPAIKVRPAEDADKDLADVREGLIRSIEHQSRARGVYTGAGEAQVACGIGNFRVELEYTDADAFDQDIRIRPIPDPFAVVWDPMSSERTGADARYCFVVDEVPRKTFEERYPEASPSDLDVPTDAVANGWCGIDIVRVVEYWVIKQTPRTIALLNDEDGQGGKIEDITGREDEYEGRIAFGLHVPHHRPRHA